MIESKRRIVLFAIIVITGSVLVLFDVPLIVLIPILIIVGFIILMVLGAITPADIKASVARLKPTGSSKKGSFLDRLKNLKLSKGKDSGKAPSKPEKKPEKKEPAKTTENKSGIGGHISSFFTSIRSIGTIIQERSKRQRKVGEINKQLDKTVSEKGGKTPSPAGTAPSSGTAAPAGGAGAGSAASADADPFLSLSEDEFDPGLLDGLDDQDFATPPSGPDAGLDPNGAPDTELPDPAMDIDAASDAILKGQEDQGSPDEFSGLDGGDSLDADFGDLENISLDDMDMDIELDDDTDETVETPAPEAAAAPEAPAPDTSQPASVKTAWIPSDAPKGAGDQVEDQISTQSDMAAFASGSGNDEDLLSSIASDVKHVTKERDVSLLRELKDFKAPATEIEQELDAMYKKIDSVKTTQAKKPLTDGMK